MEESTQESATTVGAAPEAATPRIDRELAPLPTQAAARAEQATPAAPRAAPAADDKPPGEVMRIGRGQGTWLAGRILDPQRRLPVVAVTLPPRREEPWMDVARLARLLKDKAELFLVETGAATWELAAALPARLDVYGGAARIWWPGVSSDSDPYGHPLVFAWCAEDGEPATRRVLKLVGAEDSDSGRPSSSASQSPVQQAIELMQARAAVTRLEHETRVLARELEQLREERSRLIDDRSVLHDSEERLRRRLRDLTGHEGADDGFLEDILGSPATFLSEVYATVTRLYPSLGKSEPSPLPLRVGAQFLASVRSFEDLHPHFVLEACAHVASGRGSEVGQLAVRALPAGAEGALQQVRHSDGAKAWRCVVPGVPGAPWSLRWWALPGAAPGALEFACVSNAVDFHIPE